jgi:hypothetical protein
MALIQENYETRAGFTLPSAYHKVAGLSYSNLMKVVTITVVTYDSKESSDERRRFIDQRDFYVREIEYITDEMKVTQEVSGKFHEYFGLAALEGENVNPISQCYVYMKEHLEEFANCTDI